MGNMNFIGLVVFFVGAAIHADLAAAQPSPRPVADTGYDEAVFYAFAVDIPAYDEILDPRHDFVLTAAKAAALAGSNELAIFRLLDADAQERIVALGERERGEPGSCRHSERRDIPLLYECASWGLDQFQKRRFLTGVREEGVRAAERVPPLLSRARLACRMQRIDHGYDFTNQRMIWRKLIPSFCNNWVFSASPDVGTGRRGKVHSIGGIFEVIFDIQGHDGAFNVPPVTAMAPVDAEALMTAAPGGYAITMPVEIGAPYLEDFDTVKVPMRVAGPADIRPMNDIRTVAFSFEQSSTPLQQAGVAPAEVSVPIDFTDEQERMRLAAQAEAIDSSDLASAWRAFVTGGAADTGQMIDLPRYKPTATLERDGRTEFTFRRIDATRMKGHRNALGAPDHVFLRSFGGDTTFGGYRTPEYVIILRSDTRAIALGLTGQADDHTLRARLRLRVARVLKADAASDVYLVFAEPVLISVEDSRPELAGFQHLVYDIPAQVAVVPPVRLFLPGEPWIAKQIAEDHGLDPVAFVHQLGLSTGDDDLGRFENAAALVEEASRIDIEAPSDGTFWISHDIMYKSYDAASQTFEALMIPISIRDSFGRASISVVLPESLSLNLTAPRDAARKIMDSGLLDNLLVRMRVSISASAPWRWNGSGSVDEYRLWLDVHEIELVNVSLNAATISLDEPEHQVFAFTISQPLRANSPQEKSQ